MKRCIFLLFLCAKIGVADLYPLATILGEPDMTQNFVRNLVRKEIALPIVGNYEVNLSTELYSLLSNESVSHTLSLKAVSDNYSMSYADGILALEQAASEALVVFWIFRGQTGSNDRLCKVMAHFPDVAFVFPAGSDGQGLAINPVAEPHCLAKNILIVAALDQEKRELASFSNYGRHVRLAAPGVNVAVVSAGGVNRRRSGLSPALAFAAAGLVRQLEKTSGLKGAELIDSFLANDTVFLPSLNNKIEGGRAIFSNHVVSN